MLSNRKQTRPVHYSLLAGLAVAAGLLSPVDTAGQGLSVGPVRIAMTADQPSASVEVRSGDFASAVLVQATAFTWTESDGNRELVPTEELVVTPAVFKLEPGGVRTLLLSASTDGAVPRYYRLRVEEVADEAQPSESGVQLEMLRAFDLPVFVEARGAQADVRAVTTLDEVAGEARIRLENRGNAYAIATAARLRTAESDVAEVSGLFYILPGESREIVLALPNGSIDPNSEDGDGEVQPLFRYPPLDGLWFEIEDAQGEIWIEGVVSAAAEETRPSRR